MAKETKEARGGAVTNVSGFANTQPTLEASLQTIWDAVERAAAADGVELADSDKWVNCVSFVRGAEGWTVEVSGNRK